MRDFDQHRADLDRRRADFDRQFNRAARGFGALWVLSMLVGLAVTGVVVWAVVRVVLHFT